MFDDMLDFCDRCNSILDVGQVGLCDRCLGDSQESDDEPASAEDIEAARDNARGQVAL